MIEEDFIRKIELQAKRFRDALESCESSQLPVGLQDFPRGSCGDASLLLAKHLQSQRLWPLTYVCGELAAGEKQQFQTHAWLEVAPQLIVVEQDFE